MEQPALSSTSTLTELLRLAGGPPEAVARRILALACELLDMDIAYATTLDRAAAPMTRTVVLAVDRDGSDVVAARGLTEQLDESWCGPVIRGGAVLVADVAAHPELAALPTTRAFEIASHAGVVVPGSDGGAPIGTLCVLGHRPHPTLNERDAALLRDLASAFGPLMPQLVDARVPAPRASSDLGGLTSAVLTAEGVEGLTRPLLETLQELTNLGSTYLTQIHEDRGEQEIRFALNTRPGFEIPEGLRVPWADTLCKRALEEGRVCTTDVPEIWGDSDAAAALGIQVYVSVPVELSDGRVWGTLCAADSRAADQVDEQVPTMRLFSRLIAAEVERTQQVSRSVQTAERALLIADRDALTGCTQRRLVEPWLTDALRSAPPDHEVVVAFLDVDEFKTINDTLGHAAGDVVLVEVARRVRRALRPDDLLARYGGDEFLVAAVLPAEGMPELARRLHELERLTVLVNGEERAVGLSIGIVSQPGDQEPPVSPSELIARADSAMYAVKGVRRA